MSAPKEEEKARKTQPKQNGTDVKIISGSGRGDDRSKGQDGALAFTLPATPKFLHSGIKWFSEIRCTLRTSLGIKDV